MALWLGGVVAATSLVVGCVAVPSVRNWLSSPLSDHLGKLSFPLYLIHGPVLCLVGDPLMRHAGTGFYAALSIDLFLIALSFAAAYLFSWTNTVAITVSHAIGERAADVIAPEQNRKSASDFTTAA